MKVKMFLFLFLMTGFVAVAQPKQYVCTPCGQECDKNVLDHSGTCATCGMALVDKASVSVKNLSIEELCARIAANPKLVLLDVRSPEEFGGGSMSYGHFRNAKNINVTELESRVKELSIYKNQEIIVYCSHSHRSPRAAYFLSTQGFKYVSNMAGGVSTFAGKQDNDCLQKNFIFH
jgi:rhodanese-related sulfurtransferase